MAAVNFNADQTLVGTAMNLLGVAAATVFVKAMNTAESVDNVSSTIQYIGAKNAFLVPHRRIRLQLVHAGSPASP